MIANLFPLLVCAIAFYYQLALFRRRNESLLRRGGAEELAVESWGLASACSLFAATALCYVVLLAVRLMSIEFAGPAFRRAAASAFVGLAVLGAITALAGLLLLRRPRDGSKSRRLVELALPVVMAGAAAWSLMLLRRHLFHEVMAVYRPAMMLFWIGAIVGLVAQPPIYARVDPRVRKRLRIPARPHPSWVTLGRTIASVSLAATLTTYIYDRELKLQLALALLIAAATIAAQSVAWAVVAAAHPLWSGRLRRTLLPGLPLPVAIAARTSDWVRSRFDQHFRRQEQGIALRSPLQMACHAAVVIVPGTTIFVRWTALHAFVLLLTAVWATLRTRPIDKLWHWNSAEVTTDATTIETSARDHFVLFGAIGFVVAAAALGWLLTVSPFYFTSDDNLVQFLPVIEHGCELLFRGEFPAWNPYQFLGMPTAGYGTYALTYPGTWLSYLVARDVVGDTFATLEVFCVVHLLLGYLAAYVLGLRLQLSPPVACAVALSYALSGFFLSVSRSWYYIAPTCLFVPLLALLVERLRRGPVGWKWIVGLGLTMGIYFHSGNAQMWLYAMIFMSLEVGLLLCARAIDLRRCLPLVCGGLLGAAIAMPLALSQAKEIQGVERTPWGDGFLDAWHSLFLPMPRAEEAYSPWIPEAFYSGSVFTVSALLLLSFGLVFGCRCEQLVRCRYVVLAVPAALWAIGPESWLWPLLTLLPPFNAFTNPCKLFAWLNFYFLFAGGIAVMRMSSVRLRTLCAATAVVLTLFHVSTIPRSFFDYDFTPHASPLDPETVRKLAGARSYSSAVTRSRKPDYIGTLHHNFPTLVRVPSSEGYADNLVDASPWFSPIKKVCAWEDPVILADYGIRWVVRTPDLVGDPGWTRVAACADGVIWDTNSPDVCAVAFATASPTVALPIAYRGEGFDVDVASLVPSAMGSVAQAVSSDVVLNFHYRPFWRAELDGRPIQVKADDRSRMIVEVPSGSQKLRFRYVGPWRQGLYLSAVCVAAAVGLMFWMRRRWGSVSG